MYKKPLIITGIILGATAVVLGVYGPALIFTPPPAQPSHEQVSFQLSTDTTPGNTDEYDSHSFNIYLEHQQELSLDFYAEGAAVLVSVITPSEEKLGYETSDGRGGNIKDTGLGRLREKRTTAVAEGHFRFTAPESGLYVITVKSATPKGEIDVLVDYQLQ